MIFFNLLGLIFGPIVGTIVGELQGGRKFRVAGRGRGEMWRKQNDRKEVVALEPGICLTLPIGTHFQFRTIGEEPFSAVGFTMSPGPDDEAYSVAEKWDTTFS